MNEADRAGQPAATGSLLCKSVRSRVHRFPAGTFRFTTALPTARLDPLAKGFWEIQGDFHDAFDQILATDDIALVVNLGSPQRCISSDGASLALCDAWIAGPRITPLTTVSSSNSWVCGIRLTSRGAFQALRVSPRTLVDTVVDLRSVELRLATLADRVRDARNPLQRFSMLAEYVLRRADEAPAWKSSVDYARNRLQMTSGAIDVQSLADEIGWSRQHLHKNFVEYTGLSPKTAAKLVRFRRAIDLIGGQPDYDLAAIASAAGYFDQAHLNRDFVAFAGLTPGRFLAFRSPGQAGFALD